MIILAKQIKYDFDDIVQDVLENKSIIAVTCDDDHMYGIRITNDNFDEKVAEYWESNHYIPSIFVDCLIYENNSVVNIPKGEYIVQHVAQIE